MARAWLLLAVCLGCLPCLAAPPADLLGYYNAAGTNREQLLRDFIPEACIPLNEARLAGWGYSALTATPSPHAGKLAAFEDAAPLGFSRADVAAAVRVRVKQFPGGQATLSGRLDPVGLQFRHEVKAAAGGELRIPVPAAALAPGDYSLKVCLRAGEAVDCADLPLVIGPYMQRDRFHAYSWNSGGRTAENLQEMIRWTKLCGLDVLDTPILPATAALREGLWVSAHSVTIYGPEVVGGYAATQPYTDMARAQAEAIGTMARRYGHIRWSIPNSEYGSDRMLDHPGYEAALKQAVGVGYDGLRLQNRKPAIPAADLPTLAPGVYAHDLPELAAHRFARSQGEGWFALNRQYMAALRQQAPWLTLWTDPVYTNEQFEGFDAVSFWQYDNDPAETVVRCHQAEGARRVNNARQVFLTLSQWYADVEGADKDGGWGLKSPDQHRFEGWLTLCSPVQALGYWEISKLEANPDCAAGLRSSLNDVVYPYGTLLGEAKAPPAPVAVYVSTTTEFLGRAHRPLNFWFFTHYLRGVLPALWERFQYRVDWLDDQDVLAGRLGQYRLVICPLFVATTDTLLAKLQAYQAAGGLLAGDEFWGVTGLKPASVFPGKLPSAYGIPYANADLPRWRRANRDAIMQWQPEGLPPLAELVDGRPSSPDVFTAVKQLGPVKYVVAANGRFRKGDFSQRHGYTGEGFRDEGVAQEVDFWVRAGKTAVIYDVLRSRRVPAGEMVPQGDRVRLRAALAGAGGALYAVHPRPFATLAVGLGTTKPVTPGTALSVAVTLRDDRRQLVPGRTAVRVTVRDARGAAQDVSGYYPVPTGQAAIPFAIPLDAAPGKWTVQVKDLTSGLTGKATVTVKRRGAS